MKEIEKKEIENKLNETQRMDEEKNTNEKGAEVIDSAKKNNNQMACDVMHAEQEMQKAGFFRELGIPSFLYAVIYTVCMFQNSSGITMPIWIAATIIYACTVMKRMSAVSDIKKYRTFNISQCGSDSRIDDGKDGDTSELSPSRSGSQDSLNSLKKGSGIYMGVMLLLGISTFMTDNFNIILFNYIGFFMVLITFLLHNFYDDSQWEFGKSMLELAVSVFGAVGCMLDPILDGIAFYQARKSKNNHTLQAVMIGLACAVPLLIVLGACLMDADAVFGSMIFRILDGFRVPVKVVRSVVMLLFGFFSSYCGMRFLALRTRNGHIVDRRRYEPVIALTFTGLIAVMYLIFCFIQIVYLFAGNMRLPEGMTYAEYAHNGFFQLLFVCIINLCLVLLVQKYFIHQKMLEGMLLIICICTYIMIASSAYRMILYISTYQLTFLRVLVLVVLGTLALLMAGVICLICKPGFLLFRYSMLVVSVVYLGFSFSHVDYFIASYNLSHAEENIDWWYLSGLSMDAAPAIADYYKNVPKELQSKMDSCVVQKITDYYKNAPKGLRSEMDDYAAQILEEDAVENEGYNQATTDEDSPDSNQRYPGYESWDYEVQLAVGWYGTYMSKVFEVRKDMGMRNFNISRFLAVCLLLP